MAFAFRLDPQPVPRVETAHRRIVTHMPAPGTREIMERISKVESSDAINQTPVIWDRAQGHQVFDPWGNAWIDFSSTIFVANCGHAHPHMVKALQDGAAKLCHAYSYPTEIRARYLEKLIAFVPDHLQKALLFSTGTEASERAIGIIRNYGMTCTPRRKVIVGWDGNFHGKTMGALMAGGYHKLKDWIGYQDPGMVHLPFPYPWVLEERGINGAQLFAEHAQLLAQKGVSPTDVAGFIVESYQGWGGIFYPDDYIQALRHWCDTNKALLAFDEIQAGFGRTGKLFAYEYYGVAADLITCGKGISGSVPLSAVLGRAELIELDPAYTSSHGGHPLACTAGLANIEIFEAENLIAESKRKEAVVAAEIERWKARFPDRIGRVYGRGLLWGIFLVKPGTDELDTEFCANLVERSLHKGVFNIHTGRGTIKLGPPLNIPDEALVEGLRAMEDAIAELISES